MRARVRWRSADGRRGYHELSTPAALLVAGILLVLTVVPWVVGIVTIARHIF